MLKSGARLKRRSGLERRTRLKPRSRQTVSDSALDKLARWLVFERDNHTCQRCTNSGHDSRHRNRAGKIVDGPPQIHWAHVRAGRADSIKWLPWAAMCLCAGCHFWYDGNGNGKMGSDSRAWWAEKFPDREVNLRYWETQRSRPKVDREAIKLYLESEIAKYAA